MLERFYKTDGNKVTGLLAYALYKVAKREWATEQWEARQTRPTADEMNAYTRTWTKSLVDAKLAEAESMLAAYAEEVIRDATPAIREDAVRGTLGKDLLTALAAAALYTLILIGAAAILEFAGVDLAGVIDKVHALNHPTDPSGARQAVPATK